MQEKLEQTLQDIEIFIQSHFTIDGVILARIITFTLALVISFMIFYLAGKGKIFQERFSRFLNASLQNLEDYMRNKKRIKKLNFAYIDKMLTRTGMKFKFKNIGPVEYLILNVLATLAGSLYGLMLHPLAIIPGAILGWNIIDLYIRYSNNSDNAEMMEDIRIAIVTLKMQTRAGLFITNTLAETLTVVKNKRLKAAIIQLSGDIYGSETIDKAVDAFNDKFDNMYIDALSVIIKQNAESGKASQSLKDIEVSLDAIQEAIFETEKKRMELRLTIIKLMIYGGVLAIIIYGLVLNISQSEVLAL